MIMSFDPEYLDEFVRTWLVHNETGWPNSDLYDHCRSDPEKAWALICALTQHDLSDSQMCALGAGPVETLMRQHGAQFIDRLESLAASSETFRECLKRSHPTGQTDEIVRRMGIASGVSWVDYSGQRAEINPALVRYNRQWGLHPRYVRGRFLGMSVARESADPELAAFELAAGDLIVSVNGQSLSNATRARETLARISDPRALRLGIIRDGRLVTVTSGGSEPGA